MNIIHKLTKVPRNRPMVIDCREPRAKAVISMTKNKVLGYRFSVWMNFEDLELFQKSSDWDGFFLLITSNLNELNKTDDHK